MAGQAILSDNAVEMMAEATQTDAAIEELVREHARFVYRLAYSILRNPADAEDATQEIFLRVLKYKSKLADVRDQKVWLARIAWRATLDWKKSHRRPQSEEADADLLLDLPAKGMGTEQMLAGRQMQALLEQMMATLPADLRETLALSTVQELNSAEIAAVLGVPESSVRTRLMRARTLLKQKLAAVMEGRDARQR